jgi:D-alanyl-D-alanine carboxypeptidase/D-alanyl-D-alanine-endopeptidase (penicillin-binding protein 4)
MNHRPKRGAGELKKTFLLFLLILIFPSNIRQANTAIDSASSSSTLNLSPLKSIDVYKATLASRGINLDDQGVLIETMDGRALAGHNADMVFNPASVIKLATSFVALSRLGPDHRYRTNFLIDGVIDVKSRKLAGDLVVEGGFDPLFSRFDAEQVASALMRVGISRVAGSLRISGGFYFFARGYHSNLSRETSAAKLRQAIERAGLRIEGATRFGQRSGRLIVAHYSDQLSHLLLYQNSFSSNAVAEVLGEHLGGPPSIQERLTSELGLKDEEIYIGRTSGLEFNRMTPRACLKVLRALVKLLSKYSLQLEDVMPVAGVDSGTMKGRLADERASVIAKTGTLASFDRGVSALAGIARTKRGPLLFAIFNSRGSVNAYRRFQDQFIRQIINEAGGPRPASRMEDALLDETPRAITQLIEEGNR